MDYTPRLNLPLIHSNQAQKEITHNEAITILDILLYPVAKRVNILIKPKNAVIGELYVIHSNPHNSLKDYPNYLLARTHSGWQQIKPPKWMRVTLDSSGEQYQFDGVSWELVSAGYNLTATDAEDTINTFAAATPTSISTFITTTKDINIIEKEEKEKEYGEWKEKEKIGEKEAREEDDENEDEDFKYALALSKADNIATTDITAPVATKTYAPISTSQSIQSVTTPAPTALAKLPIITASTIAGNPKPQAEPKQAERIPRLSERVTMQGTDIYTKMTIPKNRIVDSVMVAVAKDIKGVDSFNIGIRDHIDRYGSNVACTQLTISIVKGDPELMYKEDTPIRLSTNKGRFTQGLVTVYITLVEPEIIK